MSILAANVKLYKAADQTDNPTGGGNMTGTELVGGVSGNLFPSISRLDKAAGKLHLRKLFAKIDSDNSDLYGGAHAVLTELSDDTDVNELLIRSTALWREDLVADLEGRYTSTGSNLETVQSATAGDAYILSSADLDSANGPAGLPLNTVLILPGGYVAVLTAVTGEWSRQSQYWDGSEWIYTEWYYSKYTLAHPLFHSFSSGSTYLAAATAAGRCYGAATLSSTAASGQKNVNVDSLSIQLLPNNSGAAPEFDYGKVLPDQYIFADGDMVLLIEGATEEEATISSISGTTITLVSNLTNSFTAAAIMTSVCPLGDLQANKGVDFTQETWDGETFSDSQSGAGASGTYNFSSYPLSLNNHDAISDRIGLDFTSSTEFEIISERYGNLGTGSTAADVAPINPITGDPYFTLDKDGFGGTFQSGNVLRFNVIGAMAEVWSSRLIEAGATGTGSDQTTLEIRGDVAP